MSQPHYFSGPLVCNARQQLFAVGPDLPVGGDVPVRGTGESMFGNGR